jgi:CO/xanthine dehydrogenase Mo-binding subunit
VTAASGGLGGSAGSGVPGGVGELVARPDAAIKSLGRFPYATDLATRGMLHGAVARCRLPHAALRWVDVTAALALPGVRDVVTAADLPGSPCLGPALADRPVLAGDVVRHAGEAVAAIAADDLETARRAAAAVVVHADPLPPQLDLDAAATAPPLHDDGNVVRRLEIRHGEPPASPAAAVVEGTYAFAARRPAPGGPTAVLAVPAEGGLVLHTATAWPQGDRDQVAQCLNLTPSQLRLEPAGAAGPPADDLELAVLAGLLAGRTGRPVRLVADGEGGLRSPGAGPAARLHYRHSADARGRLLSVEARLTLDAGAYAGVAAATLAELCVAAVGPYRVPHAEISGLAVRTTNPAAPPLRGGGAALACVASEAQLDRLAERLGLDPLQVRELNSLGAGDTLPTGQYLPAGSPAIALLRSCAEARMPGRRRAAGVTDLPGGSGRAAERGAPRRGVGFAAGMTPLLPGEGADCPATATVRYVDGSASITTSAAELGQGFVTVALQAAIEILGATDCELVPGPSDAPSAGPATGSRLTWVAAGAVYVAARRVAEAICAELAAEHGVSPGLLAVRGGQVRSHDGLLSRSLRELAAGRAFEATETFRPPQTEPLDADGQGRAYAAFGFAAHRAVVDVDPELGLVRLVDLTCAADVGRAVNVAQLLAVLEGGTAAGVGLALLEDAGEPGGAAAWAPAARYLVPTALDMPPTSVCGLIEAPQEGSPLGAKGVWDVPVGPAAAAVLAAIRDATGAAVDAVPVRPWHLVDLAAPGPDRDGAPHPGQAPR